MGITAFLAKGKVKLETKLRSIHLTPRSTPRNTHKSTQFGSPEASPPRATASGAADYFSIPLEAEKLVSPPKFYEKDYPHSPVLSTFATEVARRQRLRNGQKAARFPPVFRRGAKKEQLPNPSIAVFSAGVLIRMKPLSICNEDRKEGSSTSKKSRRPELLRRSTWASSFIKSFKPKPRKILIGHKDFFNLVENEDASEGAIMRIVENIFQEQPRLEKKISNFKKEFKSKVKKASKKKEEVPASLSLLDRRLKRTAILKYVGNLNDFSSSRHEKAIELEIITFLQWNREAKIKYIADTWGQILTRMRKCGVNTLYGNENLCLHLYEYSHRDYGMGGFATFFRKEWNAFIRAFPRFNEPVWGGEIVPGLFEPIYRHFDDEELEDAIEVREEKGPMMRTEHLSFREVAFMVWATRPRRAFRKWCEAYSSYRPGMEDVDVTRPVCGRCAKEGKERCIGLVERSVKKVVEDALEMKETRVRIGACFCAEDVRRLVGRMSKAARG